MPSEIVKTLIRQGIISQDEYDKKVKEHKERVANPVFDYTDLSLDEAKAQKIEEIKFKAGRDIVEIAPVWKQVNILRGTGKTAQEFTDIDAIRTKSDDLEAKVAAATTVDEVKAIVW